MYVCLFVYIYLSSVWIKKKITSVILYIFYTFIYFSLFFHYSPAMSFVSGRSIPINILCLCLFSFCPLVVPQSSLCVCLSFVTHECLLLFVFVLVLFFFFLASVSSCDCGSFISVSWRVYCVCYCCSCRYCCCCCFFYSFYFCVAVFIIPRVVDAAVFLLLFFHVYCAAVFTFTRVADAAVFFFFVFAIFLCS